MGKNPAQKLEAKKAKKPVVAQNKTAKPKRKKTTRKRISASTKVVRTELAAVKTSKKAQKLASKPACKIKACKRRYRAKGYCAFHYSKWRHGEYGASRYTACSDESCHLAAVVNRHGYCEQHYQAYYVKGIVAPKPVKEAPPAAAEKAEQQAKAV